MNSNQFDRLTRAIATHSSYRNTRRAIIGGGLGLAGALLGTSVTGQEATPPATSESLPDDPHPSADAAANPEFLFVQHFDTATWTPKEGEEGRYVLTLTGSLASTTYFSDRPERIVGITPTQQFVDALGFTPTNPPNAAVVAHTEEGDLELLVIELYAPSYDAATQTLTYEAHVLEDYGDHGLAHLVQQQADFHLPETLGDGSLFIDDCPGNSAGCYLKSDNQFVGNITVPNCFNHTSGTCEPCSSPAFDCVGLYNRCYGTDADGDFANLCSVGPAG